MKEKRASLKKNPENTERFRRRNKGKMQKRAFEPIEKFGAEKFYWI